jgi:hypothetical protein
VADQRHLAGDAIELLAQEGGRGDNDGLHCQQGLRAPFDGGITRDLEVTDHLDGTGAGLRQSRGLAAQHGTSGAFGVERIALTMLMPQLAIGTTNLEDLVAICLQGACQSRTVGTGAFDAEGPDGSEGLGPCLQIAVAGTADRDGQSWLWKSEQRDKWSFCLTTARMAGDQER